MTVEQKTRAAADLAWLTDDFVERVAQAQKAIVLSADGLLMAASAELVREDAEHLAAVAASMFGLARGAGRRFGKGKARQAIIEMDGGYLFVTAAGNGACLAVVAGKDADAGLVAYEMAMLVVRVGQYLTAPARGSHP
ncbi:dynein regulation protein LC7 [Catellatospora methionotrophica]|uniref:Dynein regulation protein LC7 n=1 Tax=Catellatospora methionotrophica TaxID=121620 RepID=A0A8J3LN72_9ACTN|nr:dynein regulation protein LC7 [Catellatospora methionotrophica]